MCEIPRPPSDDSQAFEAGQPADVIPASGTTVHQGTPAPQPTKPFTGKSLHEPIMVPTASSKE